MAKVHPEITPPLREFIERQPLFFVATAPLAADGHVNLSPKGLDALRVLAPDRVAYLDLTGSGNETAAHLRENGRITLMFCAFADKPLILRLYGRGEAIHPRDAAWNELVPHFHELPGQRQIVRVRVESVQTSCGYAVPLYVFEGHRDLLTKWAEKKGDDGIREYWAKKNTKSIDGLPTGLLAE